MTIEDIERDFKEKISEAVRLMPEGIDRYRVFTPFLFEDGDHLAIILTRRNSKWLLTDEGHTYMHLTYDIDESDLRSGNRQKLISNALSVFHIEDDDGELRTWVREEQFGNALYSFAQAIIKIADVSYLSRERVRSTFMEDFRSFVSEKVPESRRVFSWYDPIHDPQAMYAVDCRINGMPRPLVIFALPGDDRTRDATIALLQFEKWGISFRSLAIFEDQEMITRKVLARFSDVCEKQFSSLESNKDRISKFFEEILTE
jgi:hypothetical protein